MFREFECDFTGDDVRRLAQWLCEGEDIDTVFTVLSLRCSCDLRRALYPIERMESLGDDGLDSLHRGKYRDKKEKIERKLLFSTMNHLGHTSRIVSRETDLRALEIAHLPVSREILRELCHSEKSSRQ